MKPWLLTIVRREHARLYERKRHQTVPVEELVENESAELAAAGEQEILDLRRAIFALDADYREPLVMQVLLGYSIEEIAGAMEMNPATVLTRLFRARKKLAAVLDRPDALVGAEGA